MYFSIFKRDIVHIVQTEENTSRVFCSGKSDFGFSIIFCQKEEFMCFESPLHHHHLSTFFDDVKP